MAIPIRNTNAKARTFAMAIRCRSLYRNAPSVVAGAAGSEMAAGAGARESWNVPKVFG